MDTNGGVQALWFSTKQAAKYLGVSPAYMSVMRVRGVGPSYFNLGGQMAKYRGRDLDTWLASKVINPKKKKAKKN